MNRTSRTPSIDRNRNLRLEQLEARHLLTAVPFGPEIVIDTNEASDILVVMADLDGDGDLDMVGGDDGLFWYENTDGDGTFGAPQTIADSIFDELAVDVRDIEVGDIDGDGDLDVLASSITDSAIRWWANNGSGSFAFGNTVSGQSSVGASVHLADYDNDGDLDVLADGDGVDIYANNGSGSFSSNGNFNFAINYLDTADFDRDGSVDVVAADVDNNRIYLRTAAGTAFVVVNTPGNLIAADLDGDGDEDVISTSEGDGSLFWYENDSSLGNFLAAGPSPITIDNGLVGAFDVRAGDFDADGDLDLLASGTAGDNVAWYENDGQANPSFTRHDLATPINAENVAIADIDGDGDLDVSYVSAGDNRRVWRRNLAIHAVHTINTQAEVTIAGSFSGARFVTTADIDRDGDLDVLGAAQNADEITWWENTSGDGSTWIEHTIADSFDGARSVASADLDGDGDLDVVGAAFFGDDITWWENIVGDGSAWTEHTIDGSFDGAFSVTTADVDGDGNLDVLGAAGNDNDITWWKKVAGNGSAWAKRTVDGNFNDAIFVTAADVDGDGDVDVLGAASSDNDITWWENTAGNGTAWTEHIIDGNFDGAISVATADVDGDGDLDVLGTAQNADDITWWENTAGDGLAWTQHTIDGSFNGAWSVNTADLDADGDIDVLGAAQIDNDITWWENTAGDGSVWNQRTIDSSFFSASSVATADVDGDGDLDVLGAAFGQGDIIWWENRRAQFSLNTFDTAPSQILPGEGGELLKIDFNHLGQSGDAAAQLDSVQIRIETSTGSALTNAEANAVIDRLLLYRDDDSNGVFNDLNDTAISAVDDLMLTAGLLSFSITPGDPLATVNAAATRSYFVVAELTPNAGAGAETSFRLVHQTSGGTRTSAAYSNTAGPLLSQPKSNVSSAVTVAPLLATSITRLDANPTNAASVSYSVVFNRDVSDVGLDDFSLKTTDSATGNVSQVVAVTPSSYTVTVDDITGDGTLRLDLADDDSIVDPSGNPLGNLGIGNGNAQGEVYSVATSIPGDFDSDNDVDGSDFLAWQRGFPATYGTNDLQDWSDNYGNISASFAAVQAPAIESGQARTSRAQFMDLAITLTMGAPQPEDEIVTPKVVSFFMPPASDEVFTELGAPDAETSQAMEDQSLAESEGKPHGSQKLKENLVQSLFP